MTTLAIFNLIKYLIDFASVDFLPYHVFPTTLDPDNFGTGWIHALRNGKQWHFIFSVFQGWYRKRREFVKLLKSQGNFNFCRKNLENPGKMKNMGHDRQQKYILLNFLLLSCSGKKFKMP